ncbi:MAG: hypothetical protein A07HN63_02548, partial [uncultured archaeon A07HN63]
RFSPTTSDPINIAEGYLDQLKQPENEECIDSSSRPTTGMKEISTIR